MNVSEAHDNTFNLYFHLYGMGKGNLSLEEKVSKLPQALAEVAPMVTSNRMWFAVCKGIMKLGLVGKGDFKSAVQLIGEHYPEAKSDLNLTEIQRLNVDSFAKEDPEEWNSKNSPVGNRASVYQTLALRFLSQF